MSATVETIHISLLLGRHRLQKVTAKSPAVEMPITIVVVASTGTETGVLDENEMGMMRRGPS